MTCSVEGCGRPARTTGLCHRCYNAKWREKHRERIRAKQRGKDQRSHNLKVLYGITLEDYERMSATQGDVCKICRRPPRDKHKRLHVDHCHATGRIRGLLCLHCNVMLGKADDSVAILKNAIDYLTESSHSDT